MVGPLFGDETKPRPSFGGHPTNSKTVLEALRALQAKIARLERERSAAVQSAYEMRRKLELIEARSTTQNDSALRDQLEARDTEISLLRQKLENRDAIVSRYKREADEAQASQNVTKLDLEDEREKHQKEIQVLKAKILSLELRNESLEALRRLNEHDEIKPLAVRTNKPKKIEPKPSQTSTQIVRVPTATKIATKAKTKKKSISTLAQGTVSTTTKKSTPTSNPPKKKSTKPSTKSTHQLATRSLKSTQPSRKAEDLLQIALLNALSSAEHPNQIQDLKKILNRINDTIASSKPPTPARKLKP